MKIMLTRRSFLSSLASTLALIAAWRPAWAQATHTASVTFVLFNDFYLMGEQPFPGRQEPRRIRPPRGDREGRARQGATKAHVIVAHGGDTLSPSVMSGLDRGAHIVALTNMIAPDIFVPGNHEFDFGKAVFLERMARGEIPALRREPARCRRRAASRLQGPHADRLQRRAHRADRPGLRAVAAHVLARRSAVSLHDRHHQGAGGRRCAATARTSSARCCIAIAAMR